MNEEEFQEIAERHGGVVGVTPIDSRVKDEFGMESLNPNPAYKYVFKDGTSFTMRANADRSSFDVIDPGTALKPPTTASTTGQWSKWADAQGNQWRVNEATGEKEKVFEGAAETPEEKALRLRLLQAQVAKAEEPTRGPLGRQLTPAELEYQQLQVQKGKLDIQKAEQDLMSRTALAQQQYYATIQTIQNQLAQGQIEPDEANHLMEQSRAYRDATVQGTTPYQVEQDKQQRLMEEKKMAETRRNNQVTTAGGVLGNRMQMGGSLASSLLSGASGIYGKILGSTNPPTDFNPLLMSQQFTDEMGGGPEMAQLARSILMGALQQPLQGGQ